MNEFAFLSICVIFRVRISWLGVELDDDEIRSYISESDKEYVFRVKIRISSRIAPLQEVKFYNRIVNAFG